MQLREAADALGVHYQTAYGWVRQGTLPARKTGRGYEVRDSDVRALAERRASGAAPRPEVRVRDWSVQADRLYDAIVSGDETLARHDVDRLALGVPLIDLCERVITPALRRVGDQWAAGELTIAAEHRASAICERLIAPRRAPAAGPPARDRGDRHAARGTARAARADGGGLPAGGPLAGPPPSRGPAGRRGDRPGPGRRRGPGRAVLGDRPDGPGRAPGGAGDRASPRPRLRVLAAGPATR